MSTIRSLSTRNRRFRDWKRDRRGATLIIVAICCIVMLGFVGVGVDFARAYAFRTKVKTVADAAAMAGAIELAKSTRANAGQVALQYAPRNTVEGARTATVTAADVQAVTWDFNSRTVTARFGNNFTAAAVNAVEVTARYSASTTFGQVFNVQQIPIVERTVAALGGVGTQDCLRPWAVSYQTLLNQRFPPSGPSGGTGYNLTPDDVSWLTNNSQPISLLQGNQNPVTPGNIAQVVTWQDAAGNGNVAYRNAILGNIPCSQMLPIGPGTWLNTDPGGGYGQTAGAIEDFCRANGGIQRIGGNGNNSGGFSCRTPPAVKLAMWDQNNGLSGNNLQYRVKYTGVFKITGFQPGRNNGGGSGNGACGPASDLDQICGTFSTMATNGAFTGSTGMTQKPAIVL